MQTIIVHTKRDLHSYIFGPLVDTGTTVPPGIAHDASARARPSTPPG